MKSNPRLQAHLPFVILLLATIFHSGAVLGMEKEGQPVWGVNAIVLKSPWSGSPTMDDLLADRAHTLVLNRFYRDGGQNIPATPTECRIAYGSDALLVVFRCSEGNMSFPAARRNAEEWYSLINSSDSADTLFPDQVDFLVQPDMASPSYYQFAMTPDGMKLGCARLAGPNQAAGTPIHADKVEAFEASVTRRTNEWLVYFQIPWKTLGGKPDSCFGVMPMRTRWRDGQVSSPVAFDFMDEVNSTMKSGFAESPAVDLFIETHFAGPAVQPMRTTLCRLPSGVLRWQRPALLSYPDVETRQQIWRMEEYLSTPTDTNNLAQRLYLTGCWTDLLEQEGFCFLHRGSSATMEDLGPYIVRREINAALRANDPGRACQLLDSYLGKLDKISRWWYADGSPGDILKAEWTPVTSVDSLEVQGNVLLMRCLAGGHEVDLHLVLPKTGGVRIYGSDEGYFKPAELLTLNATQSSKSCSIETADGRIIISRRPFSVSFHNAAGKVVTQIGANDLAFRFGPDGKVLAVDFKNHLDLNEVIYGFGEKYDRFNQNGNTLTLWGTDDWVGNGIGLRNTTYKIVPVIHSSKGYTIFDNSTYRLRGDIGRTDPNQYRLTQPGPIFDYYFWIETPQQALHSYTALTGRVPLPPKWVFEPWMGRGEDAWANGPLHNAVAEETNTITRFAALDIPHSAIYAEGPTADSPQLHEFAEARGIRVLGYFYPEISQADQAAFMPELKPGELPILKYGSSNETRELSYVDFTHPQAMELCRRALKQALDVGVAGSMVDFGDMVPDSAVFYDGKRGDEMHNFYSYAYHRTIGAVYREKRGDDFILYGRAASPGDQHWVGQFAGDHPGNFAGLRAVLTGALNLCAGGFSTWGSDLGGYFGMPEPAVYMRWFQFGCFSPIWRPHGKTPRDPWYYGEAAVTNYKFLAWTRENILNYTYNAAIVAHETGIPIMRSMPVSFPKEPSLAAVRDQYMFGGDLLVAPVINADNLRTNWFPSGVWTSLWDGKTVGGPAALKTSVPLNVIPVYLRPGAVVPVQLNRGLQFGQSMTSGRVSALVVTAPNGNETVAPVNEKGEAAQVTVQSEARRVRWTIENLPETAYLLVYGTTAAATVKANGEVLPKLTAAGFDSMPAGWEADLAGNRLVIRLPSALAGQNTPTREVEVDFNSGRK